MDYRLELVILPVADVDRAKAFYAGAGFALDVDYARDENFRVVQFTPPGSACSISFGIGLGPTATQPIKGLHLVVTDVDAAAAELRERGVDVGAVRHMTPTGWADGPDPEHANFNTFAEFTDPDGNGWVLQERDHGS